MNSSTGPQITGAAGAGSVEEMQEMFADALNAPHVFGCKCKACVFYDNDDGCPNDD